MLKAYGNVYNKDNLSLNAGIIGGERKCILMLFEKMVNDFKGRGFKTGDVIGIEIDSDEKPIVYRL